MAPHQTDRSSYRPTVACALYAPDSGEIALVRSWTALGQETADEALRPVQTELRHNETATEAFTRKVASELQVGVDGLHAVHGLLTNRSALLTGRQGNRRAFGAMCGIVKGRPRLPSGDRPSHSNISAGWYTLPVAEMAFQMQYGHLPHRSMRNLLILEDIRRLGRNLGYTTGL